MSRRINVRGIIWRDGRVFAVRHKSHENGGKNFWCTPGGGLDDGESLAKGVRREILEETGVAADIGRLLFIQQFKKTEFESYDFDEFLEFFFEIKNTADFDAIDLTATTHGQIELAEFSWVDPQVVDLLPMFLKDIDPSMIDQQSLPIVYNFLQ